MFINGVHLQVLQVLLSITYSIYNCFLPLDICLKFFERDNLVMGINDLLYNLIFQCECHLFWIFLSGNFFLYYSLLTFGTLLYLFRFLFLFLLFLLISILVLLLFLQLTILLHNSIHASHTSSNYHEGNEEVYKVLLD